MPPPTRCHLNTVTVPRCTVPSALKMKRYTPLCTICPESSFPSHSTVVPGPKVWVRMGRRLRLKIITAPVPWLDGKLNTTSLLVGSSGVKGSGQTMFPGGITKVAVTVGVMVGVLVFTDVEVTVGVLVLVKVRLGVNVGVAVAVLAEVLVAV